jgi:hypothetical protein
MSALVLEQTSLKQGKFAVHLQNFPVLAQKFPVPVRREFGSKAPKSLAWRPPIERRCPKNRKFPILFPVSREFGVETGSTMTGSTTTHSVELGDFPQR